MSARLGDWLAIFSASGRYSRALALFNLPIKRETLERAFVLFVFRAIFFEDLKGCDDFFDSLMGYNGT